MRPYLRYAIAGTLAIVLGAAQLVPGVDVSYAASTAQSASAGVAESSGTLIAWGAIAVDVLVLLTLAGFVASERRGDYEASRFVKPARAEAAKPIEGVEGVKAKASPAEEAPVEIAEALAPTSLVTSLTEHRVEGRRPRERERASASAA
jgi:hypothetical protein